MLYDVHDVQYAAFCPKARSLPSTLILVRQCRLRSALLLFWEVFMSLFDTFDPRTLGARPDSSHEKFLQIALEIAVRL